MEDALPLRDEVQDPSMRRIIDENITHLDTSPSWLFLAHDITCNLACPSCRDGLIVSDERELFANPSWIAVYLGQGVTPERAPGITQMRPDVPVAERMSQVAQAMQSAVAEMPAHADFLARHCRSPLAV